MTSSLTRSADRGPWTSPNLWFCLEAWLPSGWWRNGGDGGEWNERAYWIQIGIDYESIHAGSHVAVGIGLAIHAGSSNVHTSCTDSCPHSPTDMWPTTHVTFGFN